MGLQVIIFNEWEKRGDKYVPINTSEDVLMKGDSSADWIYPLSIAFDDWANVYDWLKEVGLDPKKMFPSLEDFEKGGPNVVYPPAKCHRLFVENTAKIKKMVNWTKEDEDYFKGGHPGKTYPTAPGETGEEMGEKVDTWAMLYTLDRRWEGGRYTCYYY